MCLLCGNSGRVLVEIYCGESENCYIYDLVPKGAHCGGGVLTANKIGFKHVVLLLHCVCVHN